jgi:two-component system, LytTR family, response regulator
MNKLKVLIIDDEDLARTIVRKYLAPFNNVEIIDECNNGFEAIKKINESKPDLIFLDIQMPKISGFEMLELIEDPPIIIFTTAYDKYAIKAFEVNAVDYLLKPFSQERFNESVDKAMERIKNKDVQSESVQKLVDYEQNEKESLERIVVKDGTKITVIPIEQIKYIEAQDDYVMIYSDNGKFIKQKTMKNLEEHLDPKNFVRIHRSYIVALSRIIKIESYQKDSYKIVLNDNMKLPVSRTGYSKLKEIFKQ